MVKHIVTFKLNGDAATRRRIAGEFARALMELPEKIECLRSMEVGLNENPAEDWDVVLTAVVDTMEDVEVYAKHPAHVAAASIVGPYKAARACVDYYVD
ncbi:MAG: Dabb family protein [Muribaculaceae bacterium]|nr:Dabb family protein [Muribaculaceae bacterium]